ncbi:hypothetical protein [Couchioplanes caeruleus]|uniref:hypothetical protein n=1 Tax=Couchioplanes caeruleus TaxID=56438 RepID=UPI001476199C|nr:hypothetical protein [Couchioplanes caeruleus]
MMIAGMVGVVVLAAALVAVVGRRSSAPSGMRGGPGPASRAVGFGHYDNGSNGTY